MEMSLPQHYAASCVHDRNSGCGYTSTGTNPSRNTSVLSLAPVTVRSPVGDLHYLLGPTSTTQRDAGGSGVERENDREK